MVNCKKCGAILDDSETYCRKCGYSFSKQEEMSKLDFSALSDNLANEERNNETHSASYYKYRGGYVETWMYVVTVLCPLIGIIFGSISYAKGDNEASKKLIVTSIVASVAVLVLWAIILFACIHS